VWQQVVDARGRVALHADEDVGKIVEAGLGTNLLLKLPRELAEVMPLPGKPPPRWVTKPGDEPRSQRCDALEVLDHRLDRASVFRDVRDC
jgi:hypothetical protein